MKVLSFLAAYVALLSSLAVAAPTDAKRGEGVYPKDTNSIPGTGNEKREELYGPTENLYSLLTLRIKDGEDNTDAKEKREGDVYPTDTRSITGRGEEKREELYVPTQDLYSPLVLRIKGEGDAGAKKREDLYVGKS